jgi:(S)-2-hydroxy-acid oxidase
VCIDVSAVDMTTECFGTQVSMPLGFSPAAFHCLAHPVGEIGTSRAAAKAGVNMVLSTYSNTAVADVTAQGLGNAYGMQLSMVIDWEANMHIVRSAERAGCKALVLTVDCAILGRRLNEYRNEFALPRTLALPNLPPGVDVHNQVAGDDPRLNYDNGFTWEKVKRLIASTSMPVYLKGSEFPARSLPGH